jgi:predicted HTH transcriptional regulator
MTDLTDEEIVSRLTNFEDNFVERKSTGDSKDWLKTAVAFANSVPIGYPAVLFVGVKNDGTVEGNANLDTVQQTFSRTLNEAYPPIYYTTRILVSLDKKQFLVSGDGADRKDG